MDQHNISVTIWGDGLVKKNWVNWYEEVISLMRELDYKPTHLGITSQSFNSGRVLTVARKEKDLLAKLKEGECPSCLEIYSLPKDYRQAVFDYEFLCVRDEKYISIIVKESRYSDEIEEKFISLIRKYVVFEKGEIYRTHKSDFPFTYVVLKQKLDSYEMIKKITEDS